MKYPERIRNSPESRGTLHLVLNVKQIGDAFVIRPYQPEEKCLCGIPGIGIFICICQYASRYDPERGQCHQTGSQYEVPSFHLEYI